MKVWSHKRYNQRRFFHFGYFKWSWLESKWWKGIIANHRAGLQEPVVAEPVKQPVSQGLHQQHKAARTYSSAPFPFLATEKKLQEDEGRTTENTGQRSYFQKPWQTVVLIKALTQHEVFKIHNQQDWMISFSSLFLLNLSFYCSYIVPVPPLYIGGVCGRHLSFSL